MASGSTIAAVIAKYETLTAGNFPSSSRPPIWLDEAPQSGTAGAQQRPPFVIIEDLGGRYDWTTESEGVENGSFKLTTYYNSLADADMAMSAILWNGAAPNSRQGIAFMTLDLTAPLYGMTAAVTPTTNQRRYAGLDHAKNPVHAVEQVFEASQQTRGTG